MKKCENPTCENIVTEYTEGGKLKMHCSVICRGRHNSIKSRNKAKQTCMHKHGVEHPMQLQETKDKIKSTCLERHGVEHPMYLQTTKDKIKETWMKIHGVDHPSKSPEIRKKMRNTWKNTLGVDHPFSSSKIRNAIKENRIKLYGVSHPMHRSEIKDKIKYTFLKKYNNEHYVSCHIPHNIISLLNDKNWLIEQHMTKSITQIANELGVSDYTIYNRFKRFAIDTQYHTQSFFEKQVAEFVKSLYQNIISNDRIQIKPYELDIYLPELNIAIECNGRYFHQDQEREDRKHHLCKEKGIELHFIWDDEWYGDMEREKNKIQNIIEQKSPN